MVFGIVDWLLIKQYSMLDQGSSWVPMSNSSEEQWVFSSESKPSSTGPRDETFFDAFGDIDKIGHSEVNTTNISFGKYFAKNIVASLLITLFVYLTVFYATCQAFFMILALTMKQIGYEFGRKIELCGVHQNEGDENSDLNQVPAKNTGVFTTHNLVKIINY